MSNSSNLTLHLLAYIYFVLLIRNIQYVPGGNVNILGGHSIGHSKQKKVYMYMCPIPKVFRDRAISPYSCKIVHKEILSIVSNVGIVSSDKAGAFYLVKYIFENSVNISNGIVIAETVNVRHISIFGISEDMRRFAQHSYNVIINKQPPTYASHICSVLHTDDRSCMNIHNTDWHASYSGAVRRE